MSSAASGIHKKIKTFSRAKKVEIALDAIQILKELYPDALCSLQHADPYHLLVAVRLSAQCTDARVNQITPALFEKYPDMAAMANADVTDVEKIIYSCGFYKSKASDIVRTAQILLNEYDGVLPSTLDELIRLPGVGRKTANLICGDVFGKPAIVCDTHCIRITNRLGLTVGKDPYKVEMQLWDIIPPDESNDFCHRLVLFGRDTCKARSPECAMCQLASICPKIGV